MTTTQQAPAGLDRQAAEQKMQDAGVPPEQAVAMLYAAISVSEAHIAGMQAGIEARFDSLETRLNDKIETVSRDVKDLDTRMSAEIKVLGGKIDALETKIDAVDTKIDAVDTGLGRKIDAVDTKVVAFETSLRESIKAVDTGLGRKIDALDTKIDAVDTKVVAFETSLSREIKTVDTGLSRKIEASETKSDGQVKITRAYITLASLLVGAAAVFTEVDLTNLVGLFR